MTLLKNAPIGFAFFDRDLRYVAVNDRLARINGIPAQQHIGRHVGEIVPQLEASVREVTRKVEGTGEPVLDREVTAETPASPGDLRWWRDSWYPVRNPAGQLIGFGVVVEDITERKRAEDQLQRNHDTFYRLIHNNPFGVYLVDADFRLREVSLGARKVFSNVRPLLGRDFADVLRTIWGEPFATEAIGRFRDVLETGRPYSSPATVEQRQDTCEVEAYDWRIERIVLPDGRFGVVCYFYDLSERQRWEAALRDSEERFRLLVDSFAQAVWETDPAGMNPQDSPSWRAYTGQTREEYSGTGWINAVHPDDRQSTISAWQKAVRSRTRLDLEYRMRRAAGGWSWTNVQAAPLMGPDGDVRKWVGMNIDITERKAAEQALRESEEKYRTLFNSIDEGFCIIEMMFDESGNPRDYRFIEVNPAFEKQTGLKDAIGKRMRELAPDHETYWFETYGKIALTGVPARFEAKAAALHRFYDGYAFPVGAPDQRRVAVLFMDISSRKRAEEALKEADRRKDEFLAILAHELRNPLAPIRNSLQIMRLSSQSDSTVERIVEVMDRQVTHLVRLVDDLLDVGRITSGKIQLRRERIALNNVMAASIEGIQSLLDARQHELIVDAWAEQLYVDGDFHRLAQVFSNILSNAIKYTGPGGRITVKMEQEGNDAVIHVMDTGTGIAAEDLPHVFDLFSQARAHSAQSEGGLGIGLALVRHFVEMHAGRVTATSKGAGTGTTFTVRLPLARDHAAGAPVPPVNRDADRPAPRLRVLVVDDNIDAADSLATVLGMEGHSVDVAHAGMEALEKIASTRPDIVFLDIGMPGMDGVETARRLRALPFGSTIRLVAVTGWGQEEDRVRTRNVGFDDHLVKPVDHAALIEALRATRAPDREDRPTGTRPEAH